MGIFPYQQLDFELVSTFFIHIPKTAGTSFRMGAEDFFGKGRVVYDYGRGNPETSLLCRDYLYARKDFWGFYQACARHGVALVGGHVTASRFMPGFGVARTLTFVRDPLQRAMSEYRHHVRLHGFKGGFRDFFENPRTHNRMSKMLRGVPFTALGMVGLTERYRESLAMLNARYGWNIPERTENPGERNQGAHYEFSPEDEESLRQIHHHDVVLYARCVELFDVRWRLFQAGMPFAHAHLTEATTQRIAGWAWWAGQDDDPVELEVLVNGQVAARTSALEYQAHMSQFHPPRGGHVGFRLPSGAAPGDQVQCRVAATGQMFPMRPVQVGSPA